MKNFRMKKGWYLYLLAMFVLVSCSKDSNNLFNSEQDANVSKAPVYDEELGLWVAPNFYDYDFTWVKSVKDLPVPEKKSGLKSIPAGRIVDKRDIILGKTDLRFIEAEADVPDGFVVTGIGARVNRSDDVRTLTLEYRYINNDGTMGARFRVMNQGNRAEPQRTPSETWYAVPDDYVVSGIGFRANSTDMRTQWTHYRKLDKTTLRLTGADNIEYSGCQPYRDPEQYYVPTDYHDIDLHRAVILGCGLRCIPGSDIATMRVTVGTLK